jgi:hypothetical protein
MEKCVWKKIVSMISHPEGLLKVCDLKCNGYDDNCPNYSLDMKQLINGDNHLKTGLERFVHKYPDYYNRSRNQNER